MIVDKGLYDHNQYRKYDSRSSILYDDVMHLYARSPVPFQGPHAPLAIAVCKTVWARTHTV